jgi:hypothetical protein
MNEILSFLNFHIHTHIYTYMLTYVYVYACVCKLVCTQAVPLIRGYMCVEPCHPGHEP